MSAAATWYCRKKLLFGIYVVIFNFVQTSTKNFQQLTFVMKCPWASAEKIFQGGGKVDMLLIFFQIADDAMWIDFHKTLYPFWTSSTVKMMPNSPWPSQNKLAKIFVCALYQFQLFRNTRRKQLSVRQVTGHAEQNSWLRQSSVAYRKCPMLRQQSQKVCFVAVA